VGEKLRNLKPGEFFSRTNAGKMEVKLQIVELREQIPNIEEYTLKYYVGPVKHPYIENLHKERGVWLEYRKNGVLWKQWYFDEQEGKKHGKFVFWHENGQIHAIHHYKNGLAHGLSISYYKNGNMYHSAYYVDGEIVGKKRRWDEDGNPLED